MPLGCPQGALVAVCDPPPWKVFYCGSDDGEDMFLTEYGCGFIGGTWTARSSD